MTAITCGGFSDLERSLGIATFAALSQRSAASRFQ